MTEFVAFNDSNFDTMTYEERQKLNEQLSSRITQHDMHNIEETLGQKVSKLDRELLDDPDVDALKRLLRQIKDPLEYDLVEQQNRLNRIRQQSGERQEERLGEGTDADFEARLAEIKRKLNETFRKMVDLAQSLDFEAFSSLEAPEELLPSFDRWADQGLEVRDGVLLPAALHQVLLGGLPQEGLQAQQGRGAAPQNDREEHPRDQPDRVHRAQARVPAHEHAHPVERGFRARVPEAAGILPRAQELPVRLLHLPQGQGQVRAQ